jgi:hypothetical protein
LNAAECARLAIAYISFVSYLTHFAAVSELSEKTPGVDYALSLLTNVGLAPGASELLSEASLAESLTAWIMAQSNGGVCRSFTLVVAFWHNCLLN